MIAPAACGGDDDGDDGDDGTTADAGDDDGGDDGEPDAGDDDGGEPDAGGDDAGGKPIDPSGTFLLGIDVGEGLAQTSLIATVEASKDLSTADFSLQPIFAEGCDEQGEPGTPAGAALEAAAVPIEGNAFVLDLAGAMLPEGSVSICTVSLTATTLDVSGTVQAEGEACGTLEGEAEGLGAIAGTFGSVRIEPETPPEDLPDPITACQ